MLKICKKGIGMLKGDERMNVDRIAHYMICYVSCLCYVILYIIMFKPIMPVTFATLNVNGLNAKEKQYDLNEFTSNYRLDIILIQEHNLNDNYDLEFIERSYDAYVNTCSNLKGGVLILIRKHAGINIINVQYHHSSRIIHMTIKIDEFYFKILNIYGHSGPNLMKEREELFSEEMLYYLQGNLDNVIVGGDFNSITSGDDASHVYSYLMSNNMKRICKDLKLYDVHDFCNKGLPQYT